MKNVVGWKGTGDKKYVTEDIKALDKQTGVFRTFAVDSACVAVDLFEIGRAHV